VQTIFQLFLRNGGFIAFLLLEAYCFYLIVNHNTVQSEVWANTSLIAAGIAGDQQRRVTKYFSLEQKVADLEAENAQLRTQLSERSMMQIVLPDTFYSVRLDTAGQLKPRPNMRVIPATVLMNSISGANNWITLNRGWRDGVTVSSGVIARDGIVGIVRYVSEHYCMVMSVLHSQSKVSASVRGKMGSLVWKGGDPNTMTLLDIPKDITPVLGDSVVTSGASLMFPNQHLVGRVSGFFLEEGSNFYTIKVLLSHNMGSAGSVYIVENMFKTELDSLKTKIVE
jgi:rod shape-determining protein MreC